MAKGSATTGETRKWLIWLHRVGYVATAVCLAEALLVAVVLSRDWLHDRNMRAEVIALSRTHHAPLSASGATVDPGTLELLSRLPPLKELHGNGLRFVVAPFITRVEYGVAISLPRPDAAQATGVFISVDRNDRQNGDRSRAFLMPATAFRALMSDIETLTDKWPGDTGDICIDGAPVAFERVRGQSVTSGHGNCSEHYRRLKAIMFAALQRFASAPDLPRGPGWDLPASAYSNDNF